MSYPLISIIIPTYNRAHLIGETLDSLLAQTYQHWECIVVDDGSTDATEELLAHYTNKDVRFQFYHRPEDRKKGANACRNFGFEHSKGEYVNWFDSDDIMEKTMLEQAVSDLESDASLQFVLFDYCHFEDKTNKILLTEKTYTENLIEDYATWKINFGTWAIVWKREIVTRYRFDESLSRAQDLDFNTRIFFNETFRFKNTNTVGIYLRSHDNRLTEDFNKMNLNSLLSEVKVRRALINNLIAKKTEEKVILASIAIFTIGLMKLVRGKYHFVFLKEVKACLSFRKDVFRKIVWFSHLLFLTLVHQMFAKGDLKIKRHLEILPFGNSNL